MLIFSVLKENQKYSIRILSNDCFYIKIIEGIDLDEKSSHQEKDQPERKKKMKAKRCLKAYYEENS